MEDKELNNMLSGYYSKRKEVPERGAACPSTEALDKYVSGLLKPDELYSISGHVKGCDYCSEIVEGALLCSAYEKYIKFDEVPVKVKERAKSLNPSYKKKEYAVMDLIKSNVWLIISLFSLAASFFAPRYFLQFLILAVIFGLKWVFNKESTRALIMVYNTWKKHDKDSDKELDRIFKSRF